MDQKLENAKENKTVFKTYLLWPIVKLERRIVCLVRSNLLSDPADFIQTLLVDTKSIKELLDSTKTVHLQCLDIAKARVQDLCFRVVSVALADGCLDAQTRSNGIGRHGGERGTSREGGAQASGLVLDTG